MKETGARSFSTSFGLFFYHLYLKTCWLIGHIGLLHICWMCYFISASWSTQNFSCVRLAEIESLPPSQHDVEGHGDYGERDNNDKWRISRHLAKDFLILDNFALQISKYKCSLQYQRPRWVLHLFQFIDRLNLFYTPTPHGPNRGLTSLVIEAIGVLLTHRCADLNNSVTPFILPE